MTERYCVECGKDISHRHKRARTCSDSCRKRFALGGVCAMCGARTSYSSRGPAKLCHRCIRLVPNRGAEAQRERAVPKYRTIERLWNEGRSRREIAEELRTTENALSVVIATLRKRDGYNLPHRNRGYD